MSNKPERTKPLNTCHNPAGCTNACRPGYNFCEPCREYFGMTKHEEERKKAGIPVTGKYRHKIIGVGEAAQTHLRLQEATPMDTTKGQVPEKSEHKAVCSIHGEHNGKMVGHTHCPDVCPKCESEKKSKSLEDHNRGNPKTGVFFEGWLKDWIESESATMGVSVKRFVTGIILDRVPADIVKLGVLADLQRKG